MEHVIEVENISCGGCASTITHSLQQLDGVGSVSVDIENARVSVTTATDDREWLVVACCG